MECAIRLNEIVDESDPDTSKSQIYHLIQTGERAKLLYPELRWLHLIGFIHDLGKILLHSDLFGEPQWCTVGDTFPVGCAFDEKNVYHKYFELNPDSKNPKYNTKYGIYEPNCGFDNVHFSWSHDEYMYQILNGKCSIPEEGLYIIRYHSFYPWHHEGAYDHLASEKDRDFKKYLNMFQVCDLYSKVEEEIDVPVAIKYYEELIKEFIPNDSELLW
jgi:inositol oxygenase